MARLGSFKVDSKAIEAGEWKNPGEEYDGLEILTRGFTDAYTDSRAAKMRRAAVSFGGDQSKVSVAVARSIMVDCMVKHVLLDVRGIEDDAGEPVPFSRFTDLLRDPDYQDLLTASIKAASLVGQRVASDVADAVGNSAPPSGTPSNGGATRT